MTTKERKRKAPYVSQGIPKEDAIVRFGDGEAMSSEQSEEQRQHQKVEARYFNKDSTPKKGTFSKDNDDVRYSKSISTIPEKSLAFSDYEAMYHADFYYADSENFGFKKALLFLNDVMKSNETTSQDYQKAKAEIERLKTELSTDYQFLEFISYFKNVSIDEVVSPKRDPASYESKIEFDKAVKLVKEQGATHVYKDDRTGYVYPLWQEGRGFYGEEGYIHESMDSIIPIKEILNRGKQHPRPEYSFKDKKQAWQFSEEEFRDVVGGDSVGSQKIPLDEKVIGDDEAKTFLGKLLNHNFSPSEMATAYYQMIHVDRAYDDRLGFGPDAFMAEYNAYNLMLQDALEEGYALSFEAMETLNSWLNENGQQENRLLENALPQTKLWQLIYKNDLSGILYEIKANGKAPVHKILAARLLDMSKNLSIFVTNDLATPSGVQAKGAYNKDSRVLYLNVKKISNSAELEEVLLHELIHAATIDKTNIPKFHNELVRLQQLILSHLKKNPQVKKPLIPVIKEAVSDIDELVAYSMTHRGFQELLKDIQDTGSKKSVWSKFVDFVAKAIGFDLTKANALSSLLSVSEDMILSKDYASNNNGLRYSIASTVTDFFTGEQRRPTSLADIDTMLATGRPLQNKIGWQHWLDKATTAFVDSTRPFERFISDTFNDEQASRLVGAADRAQGMKAAFEKQAMNLFGRDISDGVRAIVKATGMEYQTAKDLSGFWLSARYAPVANTWLMQKDQQAIADLDQEKLDLTAKFNRIKNPSQQTVDKYYKDLAALDKQLTKAKVQQTERIAAINNPQIVDTTKQPSDAGLAGGYNNATAAEYMARIEAKIPKQLLEDLAEHVYDMNEWKLKQDISNGKVSQATADKFPQSRFYVPLTGDPRTDDSVEDAFSVGSVNQSKDKQLGGRTTSIAQNGIDASFEQLEKSARYHGWNEFKTELHTLYESLIAEQIALGKTDKEAKQAVLDDYNLSARPENAMPAGENDIIYRKDGKGIIYTLHNQGAMEALRSVNTENVPSILKPIAFLTRLQARMVTQFMPGFAPVNMLRDTAERSENIRTRKIAGYPDLDMNSVANQAIGRAGKLLFKLKPVMAGVLAENTPLAKLFPVDATNTDVQQLKRFLELGGSSTYGDVLSITSKKLADKLRKTGTVTDKAMEAIELYNNAFETISGFAIYQSLVDHGVDEKKAATTALNLMNFRKRGKYMNPIRALYMFAQPIATGGHQLAKTLSTKRGIARFAAYTVAAALLYSLLRSGDDDDEIGINKMDEQGNFTLYRNILIPMGDGQYFKVPVGFGMQQLAWSQGVNLIRTSLGEMTVPEMIGESVALGTRTVMPIAPSETAMLKNPAVWFAQTFSPQVAKPFMNVALDVNAFGAPLTNARYEREDKAKSLQGRRDTPQMYKLIAQELASASGGSIDMYPEQIREFMRDYGAGVGNEVLKWAIENPAKEQRGLKTMSPALDRFVIQSNDDSLKQRLYYRKRDILNELSIKDSLGKPLTAKEKQLVELNDVLKRREARARGYLAQSTKAEKNGLDVRSKNLRARYEKERANYIDLALKQI